MKKPYISVLIMVTTLFLSAGALGSGTAEHNTEGDRIIRVNHMEQASKHAGEVLEKVAKKQARNWDNVAKRTGKDIEYSYIYIKDADDNSIKVDPPQFSK